jgi:hypothetical protein
MSSFIHESHVGHVHAENQDRVLTRELCGDPTIDLVAVADGISRCAFGASVARWLIEMHLAEDDLAAFTEEGFGERMRQYLLSLNDLFRKEFADLTEMLESGASISLAAHCAGETHCFWVGDSPIYETVLRRGNYVTRQISAPDRAEGGNAITDWFGGTSPFNLKHVQPSPAASIITITSDGSVHGADMLSEAYRRFGFSQDVAEEVVREGLLNPEADDVSVVAMRIEGDRQKSS